MAETTKPNHDAAGFVGAAVTIVGLVQVTLAALLDMVGDGPTPGYARVIGAALANMSMTGLATWASAWFSPSRWKPRTYIFTAFAFALIFAYLSWSGNRGSG